MTIDDALQSVRLGVRVMRGYVPGKQPSQGTYIRLNTNENPYPPSPHVLRAVQAGVTDALRRYSNPRANRLRQAAADLHGLSVDQVIAGNGTDDVLTMIMRTFLSEGDTCATVTPSYSLYETLTAIQGTTLLSIPMGPGYSLPDDLHRHGAKVLLIVNPNAPTGVLFDKEALRRVLASTSSIVLIDEAYAEFSGESALDLLADFPNLIVTRTLSKAYALAGMRVGLGFAHPAIIDQMMKVKDSYNLDRLAILAGCAALEDRVWLARTTAKIVATRTRLLAGLLELGLEVPPSRSNFVFPRIPGGRAAEICGSLEQRRILVRHFAQDPTVADSLRISVGTDDETEALLQALRELL